MAASRSASAAMRKSARVARAPNAQVRRDHRSRPSSRPARSRRAVAAARVDPDPRGRSRRAPAGASCPPRGPARSSRPRRAPRARRRTAKGPRRRQTSRARRQAEEDPRVRPPRQPAEPGPDGPPGSSCRPGGHATRPARRAGHAHLSGNGPPAAQYHGTAPAPSSAHNRRDPGRAAFPERALRLPQADQPEREPAQADRPPGSRAGRPPRG